MHGMLGKIAALGILAWGLVALLTVVRHDRNTRYTPVTQGAALDAHPGTRGESGVAQVKAMRGTIKTVNDRQLVLEAPGTPPTDYAFDLNGCTIRRGQRQIGPSDLVGGDTAGVLYVESGGKLIARMILVPDAETRR
jgi:hypothetical protein